MMPNVLLEEIASTASAMKPFSTVRGYVFGSVLKSNFRWTDVDVLVVCDDIVDVPSVRPALASVCDRAPIDLLVMSAAEEKQLNFVFEQGCRLLFELSASNS